MPARMHEQREVKRGYNSPVYQRQRRIERGTDATAIATPTVATSSPAGIDNAVPNPTTVTVTGTGFNPSTVVSFDGAQKATTYISATSVSFSIIPSDYTAGTKTIAARNGPAESSTINFTVT